MSITYIQSQSAREGIGAVATRLASELQTGAEVVWWLSGGSNIAYEVEVMSTLRSNVSRDRLAGLTVLLGDERYGEVGHGDSNWQQLLDAGFKTEGARVLPLLVKDKSFEEAVERYNQVISDEGAKEPTIIAQLGMGADGHIAGVLPHSVGTATDQLVIGYEAKPYTRISLSLAAMRHIRVAYVFAFGEGKREALSNLRTTDLALDEQPAQILKQIKEVYVYTDTAL